MLGVDCTPKTSGQPPVVAAPDMEFDVERLLKAMHKARWAIAHILRKCPDDVDDIVQEAALRAFRHDSLYRGDSSYDTWFYRIAINTALMHLRTRRQKYEHVFMEFDRLLAGQASPEQAAIQSQRDSWVREAIGYLPPAQRAAAQRWLDGGGCNTNREKSARHHARVGLRRRLEGRL